MESMDFARLEASLRAVRKRWPDLRPRLGIELGSGWAAVADALGREDSIPYSDLPAFGTTGVAGHRGCLSRVRLKNGDLLVFEGRFHAYEECGWTPIAAPIFLLSNLGGDAILLTNAAGRINAQLAPGDLMLICDHLNFTGRNPLAGQLHSFWKTRFVDLTQAYDATLRAVLLDCASATGVSLKEGVYGAVLGPSYETPSEVRSLRLLGADAVGMSTVFSTILGRAAGLRVAAISAIANAAASTGQAALSHQEVLAATAATAGNASKLIKKFISVI